MSMQKTFDRILTHLRAQGRPSLGLDVDSDESCAYRGEGGASCAVGCLIPDEMYSPSMENIPVLGLPLTVQDYLYGLVPDAPDDADDFLQQCQSAHDAAAQNPAKWQTELEEQMRAVAKDFSLAYREVEV